VVGNQRFGDRAASIFRVDVRGHGDVSHVFSCGGGVKKPRIMHQEPLWVGSKAVDTSPWLRTSTLKMEAALSPKRWFPTT